MENNQTGIFNTTAALTKTLIGTQDSGIFLCKTFSDNSINFVGFTSSGQIGEGKIDANNVITLNCSLQDDYEVKSNTYILSPENDVLIPENADLNDYHTPGTYICRNASVSNTIANVPVTGGGFKLIVERCNGLSDGRDCLQMVKRLDSIYLRGYHVSNDIWDPWHRLALADNSDLFIVANGDTHAAITSGQYVYVYNHSTLAEKLYTASSNIATNAALSTSNLTAVSNGGLNSLKADIDTLNSRNNHTIFNTSITLSDFINRCETIAGDKVGITNIGYINGSIANGIGLRYSGYVVFLYHTSDFKKILVFDSVDDTISSITKTDGNWRNYWSITEPNDYRKGESISTICAGVGHITSSQTRLVINVPLPRAITNNVTPTLVTSSRFTVRYSGGYVDEFSNANTVELVDNSDYNVTLSAKNAGAILAITIDKNNGAKFSVTNNTNVQVEMTPLKISFA